MRSATLLCLTCLACSGGRRPVSKQLAIDRSVKQEHSKESAAIEAPPWHMRQARWAGSPISRAPGVAWSKKVGGPITHPIRANNTGVFAVAAGTVYAFTASGEALWTASLGAAGPVGFGDAGVFVPTREGIMQVLDPDTGTIKESHPGAQLIQTAPLKLEPAIAWIDQAGTLKTTAGEYGSVIDGPVSDAASDGTHVIVGNRRGEVVATSTTETHWTADVPGPVIFHPVIADEVVYVSFGINDGVPGGVSAFDVNTGSLLWQSHLRLEPGAAPAVGEHIVVPDKKAELVALDREHGGIRWRAPASAAYSTQPATQADAIYVGRYDGRVDRIDMADGGTVWSVELGAAVTGEPTYADGRIFLGTTDGRLIALEAK